MRHNTDSLFVPYNYLHSVCTPPNIRSIIVRSFSIQDVNAMPPVDHSPLVFDGHIRITVCVINFKEIKWQQVL